jgi:tetratricopeptide (TPR) repeat protein
LARAFDSANRNWHIRELKKCEDGKLWPSAIFHLDKLIQLQPNSADYYARRGAARAELQQFDSALADFEQSVQRGMRGANNLYSIAVLYLNAGRLDDYRRICRLTLEQIEPKTNSININTRVWTCSIIEPTVADPAQLIAFMETALANADSGDKSTLLNTFGLVLYRAGRFDDAVTSVQQSMQARSGDGAITDWLILALSHHKLGHSDQSRKWLEKAAAWIDEFVTNSSRKSGEFFWDELLECRIMRAEAESLIGTHKPDDRGATIEQ